MPSGTDVVLKAFILQYRLHCSQIERKNIHFTGLETSTLMYEEACRINHQLTGNNQIDFKLYDGMNIPFPDNSFNKVFTVNTLYF